MHNFQQYLIQEKKNFLRLDIEILDSSSYKERCLFRKTEHLSPMSNVRNNRTNFLYSFLQDFKKTFV